MSRADTPIAAHRLLGDGRGAALVDHGGTVDWWCAPEFDSPPLLWSLLDDGGARSTWVGASYVETQNEPAGPVVHSVVRIAGRRVHLRDALVTHREGSCLVRLARLEQPGQVDVRHRLALAGFDGAPWAEVGVDCGISVSLPDVGLAVRHDGIATSDGRWLDLRMTIGSEDWSGLVVAVGCDPRWRRPADAVDTLEELRQGATARANSFHATRHHPGRAADALAVLHACTDRRTGALVASPTTSLPEAVGADRQFDYRYCWIRDAALATSVAASMGQPHVAQRYLRFVADVVLPRPEEAPPVVRTDGRPVPVEHVVDGIAGWQDSLPVRVGNAAAEQVQYDAWGFVLEAVLAHCQAGGPLDQRTWDLVRTVADRTAEHEPRPESGIWELRQEKQLLSADIGRWLVLDRAVRVARSRRPWHSTGRWRSARDSVRATVLAALRSDGSLPQAHDDSRPDASALMAVLFGLLGPDDPRAHRLVDTVLRDLGEGPHVRRYPPGDDGFAGIEGAFLPLSWWAVSCLAVLGRLEEAEKRADALCAELPQLMPEMIDPVSGGGLGNVPLVWTHMEVARALICLDTARRVRRYGRPGVGLQRFLRSVPHRLRR